MSAEVNTIYRYQAVCLACGWWSQELESEEAVEADAAEHNAEEHLGARDDTE